MSNRRILGLCVAISVLSAALATTLSTALADHEFPDVSAASFFHDAIDEIAGAGCATGFPDGTFHPTEEVKRQQFAFWLNNCGGRVATAEGTADFITSGDQIDDLVSLTVETGGAPSETEWGLWHVTVDLDVATSDDQQTTWSLERLQMGGTYVSLDEDRVTVVPAVVMGALQPSESSTMTALVESQAGASETFRVSVERENGAPNATLEARLTAMYFPFNGLGEAHEEP